MQMNHSDLGPAAKFDLANHNFKQVYRNRNSKHWKKYKYLPDWIVQKSEYLLNDDKAYRGNKKVYRRGAFVNVDFGVNVGQELSGNHFAIILNKDDSPTNDKLTVVPLTSHDHPHTVELDHTLRESASNEFQQRIVDFMMLVSAVNYLRTITSADKLAAIKSTADYWNSLLSLFEKDSPAYDFVNELSHKSTLTVHSNDSAIKAVQDLSPKILAPNVKGGEDPISLEFLSSIIEAMKQYIAAYNTYSRYDKTTYAKVLDITTVSKARLRKLNYYDPIGKIRVSDDVLNIIDREIKLLFLK